MLRFGGYLLRFHLASDWSRNKKHSRNFIWCSRFYGKDCNTGICAIVLCLSKLIIENKIFIDWFWARRTYARFLAQKQSFLTESWTYCKISLVTFNQVSQFVQKSSPVWCIHCSPRTAQFKGLLGCFYSDINICLEIRKRKKTLQWLQPGSNQEGLNVGCSGL